MASIEDFPLPDGYRLVDISKAARLADVDDRTMRRHCANGDVWSFRLFNRRGPWRVVVNRINVPADPPRGWPGRLEKP